MESTENKAEAIKWYKKAAKSYHPGAEFILGMMYAE